MFRPVIDLRGYYARPLLFLAVVTAATAGVYRLSPTSAPALLTITTSLLWVWTFAALEHHLSGRLADKAWRFRTLHGRWLQVHYPRELAAWLKKVDFIRVAEREGEAMTQGAGISLPRTVRVYLLSEPIDVERVYGGPVHGFAMPEVNGICMCVTPDWEPTFRHELAHLIQHRLNSRASALLDEGLAVWYGYGHPPPPPSPQAVWFLDNGLSLRDLCDPFYFRLWSWRYYSYELAGHFTRFLIERYGWERYRELYRRGRADRINKAFRQVLGLSLRELEARWCELLRPEDPIDYDAH